MVSAGEAETGSNVVLPHLPQNFTPSAKREWHFVHWTTTSVVDDGPVRLSRLPPRDGVNRSLEMLVLN
jgi:hypothetical protein